MKACQTAATCSRQLFQAYHQRNLIFAGAAQLRPASSNTQKPPVRAKTEEATATPTNLPTKETLLRVDWMLEHMLPGFMKSRMKPFFDMTVDSLAFEDKLYNYKLSSKMQLLNHFAKVRMYYRYLSPYNKVEYVGSCVYEGEDVVVVLWRLSSLQSSIWTYLPTLMSRKEAKINVSEGALDVHVTPEGFIYKIVNRKVTASDLEGAKVLRELKHTQSDALLKEEEKEWRKNLREEFEREGSRA